MINEASGHLNKIIASEKNKDTSFWVCLAVKNNDINYKIIGNVKFLPELGDFITASGINNEKNNYNEICLTKSDIIIDLPRQHKLIYDRLYTIYGKQIDKTINKNIIDILSKLENIWILLSNKKLKEHIKLDNTIFTYLYDTYSEYINKRFNCEYQKLYNFLKTNSIKLNSNQIQNLLNKYLLAQSVIDIIIDTTDDYKILELLDVDSIGMKSLLNMCDALNMSDNKKINICIINSLLNNANGDSCLDIKNLQTNISDDCNKNKITYKNFDENLTNLVERNYIYIYNNFIYAKQYYEAEIEISKYLVSLSKLKPILSCYDSDADTYINNDKYINTKTGNMGQKILKNMGQKQEFYSLNEQQKKACMQIFKNNFCITNGKAGTGKSSSIVVPLLFFNENKKNYKYKYTHKISILCLSPTGKASVRLINEFEKKENNLNYEVYTIHKFNYYDGPYYNDYELTKNIDIFNEIIDNTTNNVKLIIIDEFSMIDLMTFYNFIKKIKHLSNICLLLLGDYNQLPSVAVGNLLNSLNKSIKYDIFSIVELTEIVRADGYIVTMSDNVLNFLPLLNNIPKNNNLVRWLPIDPSDENNKNSILDVLKSVNDPLILSTTNKLIDKLHEDVKLTLNPKLTISQCLSNLKSIIDKKKINLINNLESELTIYKDFFDNNTIDDERTNIYEFLSNEINKNKSINGEINTMKNNFDSTQFSFSLKNITNYLENNDLKIVNKIKIIKNFKKKFCDKFNKINKIFNSLSSYKENEDYNYLLNLFHNDFEECFIINNYRLYDKIMITKNNYNKDLMNGMIGEIIKFDNFSKELTVKFDEKKIIILSHDDFENIKLSFMITIHKSQGSEKDNVIILINDSQINSINLLYTAITRSKKTCTIIGTYDVILKSKKMVKRNSNIDKFCKKYFFNN